jgi:hypothetical protein
MVGRRSRQIDASGAGGLWLELEDCSDLSRKISGVGAAWKRSRKLRRSAAAGLVEKPCQIERREASRDWPGLRLWQNVNQESLHEARRHQNPPHHYVFALFASAAVLANGVEFSTSK